jgi:adenylate cyclase
VFRTERQRRLRGLLFLAVGLGTTGVALVAYATGVMNGLERQTVDARFSIRGQQPPPRNIVVVQVDDVTFSDMPNVQWPYPRHLHARVIDRLRKDGAKVIAFDVQFSELSKPADDNALYLAIKRAYGKVVLATTEVGPHGEPNLIFTPQDLRDIGAVGGDANFKPDKDNVIRHMAYDLEGLKGFAVVAAEKALGHPIKPFSSHWIDFYGKAGRIPQVSYSHVLQGKTPPGFFRDKIVVIGASAPSLHDVSAVSTAPLMAGPEIQASAIGTALRGFPLSSSSTALNVALILLLGLIAPVASLRYKPLKALPLALGTGAVYVLMTQVGFNAGLVLSFVYPMTSLTLSSVGSLSVHYVVTAFERERTRDIFSRFVPETVVGQVLARTDGDLRLGGERIQATLMFSDLRGFTSSAERQEPEKVIEILNVYLGDMSDAILSNGGTLVTYMGDGIMAAFGAPIEQENHAELALAAAREMICERLPKFNRWMQENGHGPGYHMGIGLNSGPIMSGMVGSAQRVAYTTIGDVTNTASRIEGLTKDTPYSVLISETTYALLAEPPDDLVYWDELEIRGRKAKMKLWALAVEKTELEPAAEAPAETQGEPEPAPQPATG